MTKRGKNKKVKKFVEPPEIVAARITARATIRAAIIGTSITAGASIIVELIKNIF